PSPKPIQKPSRRCGYCACAADAAQENAASSATIRAVCMEPSLPGDGTGGGRVPCRKRQARPRGGGVLARGQSSARSLSPPLGRCRPSRPRRSQRRCPPPETANPTEWVMQCCCITCIIGMVCSEPFVEPCIKAILSSARTGEVGDGKIFVQPIERVIRIRTGELDNSALTAVNADAVQRAALETAHHAGAVADEEES